MNWSMTPRTMNRDYSQTAKSLVHSPLALHCLRTAVSKQSGSPGGHSLHESPQLLPAHGSNTGSHTGSSTAHNPSPLSASVDLASLGRMMRKSPRGQSHDAHVAVSST